MLHNLEQQTSEKTLIKSVLEKIADLAKLVMILIDKSSIENVTSITITCKHKIAYFKYFSLC